MYLGGAFFDLCWGPICQCSYIRILWRIRAVPFFSSLIHSCIKKNPPRTHPDQFLLATICSNPNHCHLILKPSLCHNNHHWVSNLAVSKTLCSESNLKPKPQCEKSLHKIEYFLLPSSHHSCFGTNLISIGLLHYSCVLPTENF